MDTLQQIINELDPDAAYAYGSGAFPQAGNEPQQIDFILGAHDVLGYIEKLIELHPEHFSWTGKHTYKGVLRRGARIFYNPYVKINGQTIKYGVTSIEEMIRDLEEWTYLYFAGRAQKPMLGLDTGVLNPELDVAFQQNLRHSLNVALTLLPEKFTLQELFEKITSLSYTGESRPEDPNKVKNIVAGSRDRFDPLYTGAIMDSGNRLVVQGEQCVQGLDADLREGAYDAFPANLKRRVDFHPDIIVFQGNVEKGIRSIVGPISRTQTLSGVLTAGPVKGAVYAGSKVKKSLKRKRAA